MFTNLDPNKTWLDYIRFPYKSKFYKKKLIMKLAN